MGGGSAAATAAAAAAGRPGMAEGEYSSSKTSVWWDIENCAVPKGCDPQLIAQNISSALSSMGYKGPVSIWSYGDTKRITDSVQNALHSTGIGLNHVPAGAKDASDKKILVDMIFWAVDNPPPANYLLISGDRDFSNALHQLRMRRYNVLLAQPPSVSSTLVAAATSVWNWKDLVAGEPPLLESPYVGNTSNSRIPDIVISKENVPIAEQMESTTTSSASNKNVGNQKNFSNDKPDNHKKWKHVSKPHNEDQVSDSTTRTSGNESKQPSSKIQGLGTENSTSLSEQGRENMTEVTMTVSSEGQESGDSKSSIKPMTPLAIPIKPLSEAGYSNQAEKVPIRSAPHELFRANHPETSSSPLSGNSTPLADIKKNGKPSPKNHSQHTAQSPRVGNTFRQIPTQQFTPQHGTPRFHTPQTQSYGAAITSSHSSLNILPSPLAPSPTSSLPAISGLSITAYPSTGPKQYNPRNDRSFHLEHPVSQQNWQNGYHYSKNRPISTNTMCGFPARGKHSPEVETLIGTILNSLRVLRVDKIAPTEANIKECIWYGEMNKRNFNVKVALDYAIQQQAVVMSKLGNNLPFYVEKNGSLWKCVNPENINSGHPKAIWDEILEFLSSPGGQSSILNSECMYHAATVLKKSCLERIVLGEILQILNVLINYKKWIVTSPSGWQPLNLNLPNANAVKTLGSNPSN